MRLLLVELRRLFARRFFWVGGLALLVGLGTVLVATALDSTPPTDAELEVGFGYSTFTFLREMTNRTLVLTVVLAMFSFLVGATVVGAEWNHGTLTGLLLWEPRRGRVFTAKLAALLIGTSVFSVLTYAVSFAGHLLVARNWGILGPLSAEFQRKHALLTARCLAVVLVGAAIGFAIAFTLRHTAAAMGAAIAYFGIVEIGIGIYSESVARVTLSSYLIAWLNNGARIRVDACTPRECVDLYMKLSVWHGGVYLAAVTALLLAIAALVFRRREVA